MLSIFDEGRFAPCPEPFNLAAHVLAAGQAAPDKVALAILTSQGSEDWSYARLIAAVLGTATGLMRAGLVPGDIILMRLDNTVDFPIAYLGAIAAGLVPVPTSSQLTMPEVNRMIAQLRPSAILHAPGVACPTDSAVPILGPEQYHTWHSLPPASYQMGDPDRLAYVIYTSGTSGTPRAVAHAHRAIWARQMMMADWYGLHSNDRLLHAGAFNWTYTLGTGLMDPWTMGATALIPAPGTPPAQLTPLMQRYEATMFAAAPGVYRNVLKADVALMPRLRHGLSAGEKLGDGLREAWHSATGTQIYEAYGMSECSTFLSSAPGRAACGAVLGRPQQGRRVAVLDEGGQPVPYGAPGVIAVHRSDPGLMLGYLGAPEATAEKFSGEWFVTGDLGSLSTSGDVSYLGRADDMMNAGGYRVSPLEVEAALSDLPGVSEIGVTDIEIKPGVRVIAAFYTGPEPLTEQIWHDACAACLARYKQPRLFVHLPALPRNPNGKLQRKALRGMAGLKN